MNPSPDIWKESSAKALIFQIDCIRQTNKNSKVEKKRAPKRDDIFSSHFLPRGEHVEQMLPSDYSKSKKKMFSEMKNKMQMSIEKRTFSGECFLRSSVIL